MLTIDLPISKSIANRLLLLQARHGDPLMEVSDAMPDDVRLLHGALLQIGSSTGETLTIDTGNCGTAMRFLTAFCACRPGLHVILTGCERMQRRPIGQLVEALRGIGADIRYLGQEGFPPIEIHGRGLCAATVTVNHPISTQFISALLLAGMDVQTDAHSPYIDLTRRSIEHYDTLRSKPVEADWSAAAFWYEWMALHDAKEPLLLKGLQRDTWQGDKRAVELFEPLGVLTEYHPEGVVISRMEPLIRSMRMDFSATPDLYPAVVMTCHRLGILLEATGTETLRHKESDRIEAMRSATGGSNRCFGDHRVAMALLAADRLPDDLMCISKSYPMFAEQIREMSVL